MTHHKFYGTISGSDFTLEKPDQFKAHLSKLSYKTANTKIEITVRRVRKFREDDDYTADKTPGQRLRAVLYKYWENNESHTTKFEQFYEAWVEMKINDLKAKLN